MKVTVNSRLARNQPGLLLAFFSSFNLFLVLARVFHSGYNTYAFLIWNLFLAWIPFIASSVLAAFVRSRLSFRNHKKTFLIIVALLTVWLAFLPNAPYILTDLVHLKPRPGVPVFYDLVMLVSFGINGLLLALASLGDVHDVLEQVIPQRLANFVVSCVLFLTSYGIYLGRVLRWNSWDLLLNPKSILKTVLGHFAYGQLNSTAGYMTVIFFVFLSLNYFGFRLLKQRR